MRDRILQLEEESRPLEPTLAERRDLLRRVDDDVQTWLEALPDLPGYGADDDEAIAALAAVPIPEEPRPVADVLAAVSEGVDRLGVNESSGSFLGFIPGAGSYVGAVADYHAAAVNRYSGVFYAAPGAVRLGRACIEWLAGVLGYPADCDGDLTSGGSIATLSAVVTARETAGLRAAHVPNATV